MICDDIVIRKGHAVGICVYAIARQPSVWGPDASEFKPERWIDDELRLRQFPATKFFSFGAGPRSCIDMGLAMLELRIVVANLLYRYHVDPANAQHEAPSAGIGDPHPAVGPIIYVCISICTISPYFSVFCYLVNTS